MAERELATTRIALLELLEERRTAREGYDLLDEKRMLLAARMLRLVDAVLAARAGRDLLWAKALAALRDALERHGLQELELLRAGAVAARLELGVERVLGVELVAAVAAIPPAAPAASADADADASPEAGACAAAWAALGRACTELAALECSLWRLSDEYARTERRAAAIEQVLLPELDAGIATVESGLEMIEQEDVVRVHRR